MSTNVSRASIAVFRCSLNAEDPVKKRIGGPSEMMADLVPQCEKARGGQDKDGGRGVEVILSMTRQRLLRLET